MIGDKAEGWCEGKFISLRNSKACTVSQCPHQFPLVCCLVCAYYSTGLHCPAQRHAAVAFLNVCHILFQMLWFFGFFCGCESYMDGIFFFSFNGEYHWCIDSALTLYVFIHKTCIFVYLYIHIYFESNLFFCNWLVSILGYVETSKH